MSLETEISTALMASVADAIMSVNAQGEITFWNPACERVFGFTAADALGQSLDIIIPENQRARHWEGFDRTMATGESKYGAGELLSVPALNKDGGRISVEFTIVLMRGPDGAPNGIISVCRDMTKAFDERRNLRKRIAELGG